MANSASISTSVFASASAAVSAPASPRRLHHHFAMSLSLGMFAGIAPSPSDFAPPSSAPASTSTLKRTASSSPSSTSTSLRLRRRATSSSTTKLAQLFASPELHSQTLPSSAPLSAPAATDGTEAPAVRRSTSQRTPEEERARRRNRRRKSRSMTGLPIGKLAIGGGGYGLETDPDPTWDATQSDYEVARRRRQPLITADIIDDSDRDRDPASDAGFDSGAGAGKGGDLQWMFRRPPKKQRALEDQSESDLELDLDDKEARTGALSHRADASTSSLGHVQTPTLSRVDSLPPPIPSSMPKLAASSTSLATSSSTSTSDGPASTTESGVAPTFVDPFTRAALPPPPVPPKSTSSHSSTASTPTLAHASAPVRSKSSPAIPPRSDLRSVPPSAPTPTPVQQLPSQLSYSITSTATSSGQGQGQGQGRVAKLSRLFRSGGSTSSPSLSSSSPAGRVLRKSAGSASVSIPAPVPESKPLPEAKPAPSKPQQHYQDADTYDDEFAPPPVRTADKVEVEIILGDGSLPEEIEDVLNILRLLRAS